MGDLTDVGDQRVFRVQLFLCSCIGISMFVLFCFLRYKWPHIYAVRILRRGKGNIKPLPQGLFSWIKTVIFIEDEELIQCSGLDAFVFLSFFRMGIAIFFYLVLFGTFIISPLRYYFTGKYDKDNSIFSYLRFFLIIEAPKSPSGPGLDGEFPQYLWLYPIFTYIFSGIVYKYVDKFTGYIIRTRQKYLASQDSIVDRTIVLHGIPKRLLRKNDPDVLKNFIKDLGFGDVIDVKFIYDWTPLEQLFERRERLLRDLESLYASSLGLNIDIYNKSGIPQAISLKSLDFLLEDSQKENKKKVEMLSKSLVDLDDSIRKLQYSFVKDENAYKELNFKKVPAAFITMESVASAQMAAQTVLDPRVHKLIVSLAPAPKDIHWENFKLTRHQRFFKSYCMTFIILLSYAALLSPVSSLAILLNIKTISKFWPALGKLIRNSKWLTTFVTGILPPFIFSIFNASMPYFYRYLSQRQGYTSNSDIELATLSKNFFYIFFNLFLVFTISGTFSNYWSFISDTSNIPYHLATSLKGLSIFYINLILLQGLALFPFRLLQVGDVWLNTVIGKIFFLKSLLLRTARDYRFYYYTPPVFDFGITLPQHILFFIIILIYSVLSTKIVGCGLVYFCLGYLVYKYQLLYTSVHTPHSTGKVWTMIFRRLMLGLIIFQLFMCGTMILEGAILLSFLTSPLLLITLFVAWNYEKHYLPLINFIALRAIQNPLNYDKEFDEEEDSNASEDVSFSAPDSQSQSSAQSMSPPIINETVPLLEEERIGSQELSLRRKRSTLDEEREEATDYTHPLLKDHLYGPWVGFQGEYIEMIRYPQIPRSASSDLEEGTPNIIARYDYGFLVRKKLKYSEWE